MITIGVCLAVCMLAAASLFFTELQGRYGNMVRASFAAAIRIGDYLLVCILAASLFTELQGRYGNMASQTD